MAEAQRARSNRRIAIRKGVLWSTTLTTPHGKADGRIINISTTGAKVRTAAQLAVGEQITLAIRSLGEFRGRVVWTHKDEIGVHFIEPNGDDTLQFEPDSATDPALAPDPAPASSEPAPAPSAAEPSPSPAAPAPAAAPPAAASAPPPPAVHKVQARAAQFALPQRVRHAIAEIEPALNALIDPTAIAQLSRAELREQLVELITQVAAQKKVALSASEHREVVQWVFNNMTGLGPIEPLLADDSITDILVNGSDRIYVERRGKLELTGLTFNDDRHALNIASRIVTRVGRRVDETVPMADARLPDGSRVNVIIPPLALVGPMISIRKFAKKEITLEVMARQGNLSPAMATLLSIGARCRLNVLISGGTGSGKTTLLNAMSQLIDPDERIITIEDAAELQLQLPHVGGLETRIANLEGKGEVTMRDLLKNALRMRPDRIILGEIRGAEAFDMLQAMNTGHEGSLGTIHASGPREALSRLESIIAFAGLDLPSRTVRAQIASAIDLIVQVSRMRDGKRRITCISELVGMEGDVFVTQDLFSYRHEHDTAGGELAGKFVSSGLRPHFTPKAEFYNLGRSLQDAMNLPAYSDTPA